MTARLHERHQDVHSVEAETNCAPAATIARSLHCSPQLPELVQARYLGVSVIVDIASFDARARAGWWTFLARFRDAREKAGTGVALIVSGVHRTDKLPLEVRTIVWGDRLRRLDVALWADMHAAEERTEPLAGLAAALGVELCGWRLDLVAEVVRAGRDDLIDPLAWLERREDEPIEGERRLGGVAMRCPIALLREGKKVELERRIWRAHLSALFPWIEDLRQKAIDRHRRLLRINDHLRALGISDVSEIELGPLAWQLRSQVGRDEAARLDRLARIRNALAHRKPAPADDLDLALRVETGRAS